MFVVVQIVVVVVFAEPIDKNTFYEYTIILKIYNLYVCEQN